MEKLGHVIAIGGGGFGRNPNHNKIEKYILDQSENSKPKNEKEKIRLRLRKKNTNFIQLNQSVVLNELHKIYFLGGNLVGL